MQDHLWKSAMTLEDVLEVKRSAGSWRVNGEYFRPASTCQIRPGTASLALAWFQQGMAVSLFCQLPTTPIN